MRTRLVAGAPQRVTVTVAGRARVRVAGSAYGFVRCRSERRWIWGCFDLTFRVADWSQPLEIVVWGLGGRARHVVAAGPLHHLSAPAAPRIHRMPQVRVPVPRVTPLTAESIARVAERAR